MKLLARRMGKVLGKIVGKCQHIFVEGMQIMDAVLVANEVVDDLIFRNREGFLRKLHMVKAYDHVN